MKAKLSPFRPIRGEDVHIGPIRFKQIVLMLSEMKRRKLKSGVWRSHHDLKNILLKMDSTKNTGKCVHIFKFLVIAAQISETEKIEQSLPNPKYIFLIYNSLNLNKNKLQNFPRLIDFKASPHLDYSWIGSYCPRSKVYF